MKSIIKMFEETFRTYSDQKAIADYNSKDTYNYLQLATEIKMMHLYFECAGLKKGDHIAISGKNSTKWIIAYTAAVTYGAVIVPILADFNPADAANIINHSDSVFLAADKSIWNAIKKSGVEMPALKGAASLENWEILLDTTGEFTKAESEAAAIFKKNYNKGFKPEDIAYDDRPMDEMIEINYTSGTSGFSKGVMLTVRSLTFVVKFAHDHHQHYPGSRVLSLLPLAHAYGCAFDMLSPLAAGSSITLLGKIPTPAVLMKAMQEVKPHLLCTVPLVMEKIVTKKVMPALEQKPASILVKIPVLRQIVYKKVLNSLLEAFGGSLYEINMGGAALNPEVEEMLRKIKFPYTVGYGMTECGPLIAYEDHKTFKKGSCGTLLPGMEAKIVVRDGSQVTGEICVKGPNVMLGYYNNPKATAEAIDEEGWLHTGDVGVINSDGTIAIRGRCKNMILSANGQNIYPEEIEAKLNDLDGVAESLVYQESGRLYALVVPDDEEVKRLGLTMPALNDMMKANLARLNQIVAPYERLASIKICASAFEKTPKRSIRRYLYPKSAEILCTIG